jgi:hypothetical protein
LSTLGVPLPVDVGGGRVDDLAAGVVALEPTPCRLARLDSPTGQRVLTLEPDADPFSWATRRDFDDLAVGRLWRTAW